MQPTHYETYSRIAPANLRNEMQGKSVLITGGNGGIGAAIAKSFAEAHAKSIVLVGRNKSKLDATAKELESYRDTTDISTRVIDISSQESVKELFNSLPTSPDVLVNNAGYLSTPENFVDTDLEEYWKGFQINVLGTIFMTQAYLRHRKAHVSSNAPAAAVININTIAAYAFRMPAFSAYGASKAAQARWTELIQEDVPESTARFISVHPGAVRTDMYDKSELEGKLLIPLTDIALTADFVLWASGEEAKFLAGRFLHVNWDVDELVKSKTDIVEKDLLRTSILE